MTLPSPSDEDDLPPLPISSAQVALFASVFGGCTAAGAPAVEADYHDHLAGIRPLALVPVADLPLGFARFEFRRRHATSWKSDALQFAHDARRFSATVYLEVLPARNPGMAAWMFFLRPLPPALVRYVAAALLERVCRGNPSRFPSFGQILPGDPPAPVPLPLFGGARAAGEGMFVAAERGFPVIPDQWAVIASVARFDPSAASRLAPEAVDADEAPRLAVDHLDAVLSASLVLRRPLPPAIAARLRQRLSYPNPEYQRRVREGRSLRRIPRLMPGWRREGGAWRVPPGLDAEVAGWCESEGLEWHGADVRFSGPLAPRAVPPGLPADALALLDRVRERQRAMVVASNDFTRTALALAAVAECGAPALILASTRARADLWRDQSLLGGFEEGEVATLRESLARPVPVTVATYGEVPAQAGRLDVRFGFVVADDCLRVPMPALRAALECVPAFRVLGLSDEGRREDGLQDLLELLVGPPVRAHPVVEDSLLDVVLRTSRFVYQGPLSVSDDAEEETVEDELFPMPRPVRAPAPASTPPRRSREWIALLDAIAHDETRNQLVAGDVAAEAATGQRCLVLTERREHAQALFDMLVARGVQTALLTGAITVARRREALEQFRLGAVRVLVVMEQLLGPGFDPSAVNRVFLASPLRSDAKMRQMLESLQRGERGDGLVRLYDYVDDAVPRLARMAAGRRRFYARRKTTFNPDAMQLRLPFDEA